MIRCLLGFEVSTRDLPPQIGSWRRENRMAKAPKIASKAIGIWIRVSTEDQARGDSPAHHETRARMYAQSRDWEVREVYNLEAVSGKSVMGHPETRRMLQDIRSGRISGLIFSKLARLARNTRELLDFADLFREAEADLVSLEEAIDTSSPAGRLFYTMIAAMAQWEREEIASRVKASVKVRAHLGKSLGGAAPFGYSWEDGSLTPDPAEAPVRKLMFELFLEHRRKKAVAKILNERGYRTRRGKPFTDTTLKRLLRDPVAKGLRRINYVSNTSNGQEWKPEDEWVWMEVDPVVPEGLWEQVNAILDEQQKANKRPARRPVHLFAGVTRCHCGTSMYVPSNTPKYVCHKCRNKIPEDALEEVFRDELKAFFFDPSAVATYFKEADDTVGNWTELLEGLREERQRLERDMNLTYRLYLDEEISSQGFGERNRPLEERRDQLDTEILRLQGELDVLRVEHQSRDELVHRAQDISGGWDQLTFDEKRQIINSFVHGIEIGDKAVQIDLHYLPTLSPNSPNTAATRQQNPRRWSPPRPDIRPP